MKTKQPMSIKLTPDFACRLQEAADRTRIKKHLLAELAIEAAVEAIEANGFRIVMPIRFAVEAVVANQPPAKEGRYPELDSSAALMNEPKKRKAS